MINFGNVYVSANEFVLFMMSTDAGAIFALLHHDVDYVFPFKGLSQRL